MEGLDNLIKGKLLSDKQMPVECLIPWKSAILTRVDKKFQSLKLELNHLNLILFCNKLTS